MAFSAGASMEPFSCSTCRVPFRTTVNSSKVGVWPGSCHPAGLRMWATLAEDVFELTRPMYSSIRLGLVPADWMRVGCGIKVGIGRFQLSALKFQWMHISSLGPCNLAIISMGSMSVTRRRDGGKLSAEATAKVVYGTCGGRGRGGGNPGA